jgi:hypothetical protein
MKKTKTKVKSRVATKSKISVGHKVALFMLIASAFSLGLNFAGLSMKSIKTKALVSSCTPSTPRLNLSSTGKSLTSHSILFSNMKTDSLTTDVRIERRERMYDDVWSSWQGLDDYRKLNNISTMELGAYPNKHYQYRAIAYNENCDSEPASSPTEPLYVNTHDFIILNDDEAGRDPFYPGKISNTNGSPFYPENESNLFFNEIYRVDHCYGYGGIGKLQENYLTQDDERTGPMGQLLQSGTVSCEYGCFEGRCTTAEEVCQADWYCLSPSTRGRIDADCHWVEAENIPSDDFENYRCKSGQFKYIGEGIDPRNRDDLPNLIPIKL